MISLSQYLVQSWHNSGIWEFARHTDRHVSSKRFTCTNRSHAEEIWTLEVTDFQLLLLAANACQHGPPFKTGPLCVHSMGTHLAPATSDPANSLSENQEMSGLFFHVKTIFNKTTSKLINANSNVAVITASKMRRSASVHDEDKPLLFVKFKIPLIWINAMPAL